MSSSLQSLARRVPGAQVAWRTVWSRYCSARSLGRSIHKGVRLATDPDAAQYYGRGDETKPRWRRVSDHVAWAVRHRSANNFYYAFGMDVKSGEDYDRYLSVREMMTIIDHQIEADGTEHATAVLKDKFFFSLVAQALGHPSPRTIALLGPGAADLLDPRRTVTYAGLVGELPDVDGFAKPIGGEQGRGAFALRIEDGQVWVDGHLADAAELSGRVGGRFILQERIVQHPALSALHAPSVNTVRLVTVLRDGRVEPLVAALRIGVGGSPVDNWSAGGLVVGVDLERGELYSRGVFKPGYGGEARHGGFVDRHPDTGVALDGYALPGLPEAVDLARQFHLDMGGPRTVGWDLAVTSDGPVVVEGNSHWSGAMYMAIDAGFKDRYFDAVAGGE